MGTIASSSRRFFVNNDSPFSYKLSTHTSSCRASLVALPDLRTPHRPAGLAGDPSGDAADGETC